MLCLKFYSITPPLPRWTGKKTCFLVWTRRRDNGRKLYSWQHNQLKDNKPRQVCPPLPLLLQFCSTSLWLCLWLIGVYILWKFIVTIATGIVAVIWVGCKREPLWQRRKEVRADSLTRSLVHTCLGVDLIIQPLPQMDVNNSGDLFHIILWICPLEEKVIKQDLM